MTDYPGADKRQDFSARYPGSHMTPNVIVLHTTEGGSWPGYNGGSEAPNLTIRANKRTKRLDVRQHFPLDMSSRALVNLSGGVETNTMNAVQIELVGSCDRKDGYGAIYWPDAPDWCIEQLGEVLATLHGLFPAIPLKSGLTWKPYRINGSTANGSYGIDNGVRMSNRQWLNFYGICGHQHVPENDHGDPGDLPIDKILTAAGAHERRGKARKRRHRDPQPAKADAKVVTRPERGVDAMEDAAQAWSKTRGKKRRTRPAHAIAKALRALIRKAHRKFPKSRR